MLHLKPPRHTPTLPIWDVAQTSQMRKYRSFAEDLPNRPSTRGTRSRVGPVTGGVRLKAAVGATGRMRQKRTFWVDSSTVSRTPKEFSIEAASGLLNCDRRKNSSFSTVSTLSGHTGPRPWTPQLGGKRAHRGRLEKDRSSR